MSRPITGQVTEQCVLYTALDAYVRHYDVVVPPDAVAHIDAGLGEADFVNVNCAADTWSFKDGKIQCTGTPTGVMRMKEPITNFELVVQWMHQKPGGNSGVFVWASEESIKNLHEGKHNKRLPSFWDEDNR